MEKILFDFDSTASDTWSTINDGVMGGISSSSFRVVAETSMAIFSGTVSLENNGGFASARSSAQPFHLAGFSHVVLRVKGDGKAYSLRLRTDADFDGISYLARFDTRADEWMEIRLAFDDFQPMLRGRPRPDAPPLMPETIQQFGLLIADGQEGPFTLHIDWIKASRAS